MKNANYLGWFAFYLGKIKDREAYTLCNDNVEVVENRIYIPIYMIMFSEKKIAESNMIDFDFTTLNKLILTVIFEFNEWFNI